MYFIQLRLAKFKIPCLEVSQYHIMHGTVSDANAGYPDSIFCKNFRIDCWLVSRADLNFVFCDRAPLKTKRRIKIKRYFINFCFKKGGRNQGFALAATQNWPV